MKWYSIFTWMIAFNITCTIMATLGIWGGGIIGFSISDFAIALGIGVAGSGIAGGLAATQSKLSQYITSEKNVFYYLMSFVVLVFTTTNFFIMNSIDASLGLSFPISIATLFLAIFGFSWLMATLQWLSGGGWKTYV